MSIFKNKYTITDTVYHSVENNLLKGLDKGEWEIYNTMAIKTEQHSYEVPPGAYKFIPEGYGSISIQPYSILLEPHTEGLNKIDITSKVEAFLEKDSLIRSCGFPLVKQGWLLHGPPGTGKTHSINTCINTLLKETGVALYVQTDKIELDSVVHWMSEHTPTKDVTKLFVVLEDLGGGEVPDMNNRKTMESSSTILTFLDGTSIPENWRHIPIIVMSTTNYPDLFLGNLTDRPGRFDEIVSVPYAPGEALVKYAENILKNPITDFDRREIEKGEISIAHIRYAVMKHVVYGESIHNTIKSMRDYTKKVKKSWDKEKKS